MTARTILLVSPSYDSATEHAGTVWGESGSAPPICDNNQPGLLPSDAREDLIMSTNSPFLARFAKAPSKDVAKSNSSPVTIATRVERETTDDR